MLGLRDRTDENKHCHKSVWWRSALLEMVVHLKRPEEQFTVKSCLEVFKIREYFFKVCDTSKLWHIYLKNLYCAKKQTIMFSRLNLNLCLLLPFGEVCSIWNSGGAPSWGVRVARELNPMVASTQGHPPPPNCIRIINNGLFPPKLEI